MQRNDAKWMIDLEVAPCFNDTTAPCACKQVPHRIVHWEYVCDKQQNSKLENNLVGLHCKQVMIIYPILGVDVRSNCELRCKNTDCSPER